MKKLHLAPICILVCAFALCAGVAQGQTFYNGTFASPETPFETTFTVTSPSTVTLQTFGFGLGGTDPFLGVFNSSGAILTDGFGNPYGTAVDLGNYGSFTGCPPAVAPTIGGAAACGDITMSIPGLADGTYTVVLSDGSYIPNAVYDNGNLSEGFADFTAGQFCNIAINGAACPNTNGAYSLEISGAASPTPEPKSMLLWATGFLTILSLRKRFA
jgi:hypothetical protein